MRDAVSITHLTVKRLVDARDFQLMNDLHLYVITTKVIFKQRIIYDAVPYMDETAVPCRGDRFSSMSLFSPLLDVLFSLLVDVLDNDFLFCWM